MLRSFHSITAIETIDIMGNPEVAGLEGLTG